LAKVYPSRKLEVYGLNAHEGGQALGDYKALFQTLEKAKAEDRIHQTTGSLLALQEVETKGNRVRLLVYEGPPGMYPLILNTAQATTRVQKLRAGEVMATGTHAEIDLSTRKAVIEFNQRGAKAHDIALAIQEIALREDGYQSLVVELAPVVTETFLEEIEKFGRIQLANLSVTKPNVDWTDHYNNLTAVADDSDGHRITIEIGAERRGTLNPNRGIIGYIKQLVGSSVPVIKNARVKGVMKGEDHETVVSLANHIQSRRVDVTLGVGGHVDDRDIQKKIHDYLTEVVKS
jgi:hypothetical protein